MFKDMMDKNIKFETPLPLINVKYMFSDRLEGRVGLEFSKTRETIKGDVKNGKETYDAKYKVVEANNFITPGVAYHFSKHNIIDVYAGGEIVLGWNRDSYFFSEDDNDCKNRRTSWELGAGAFIGLQAYIANLPLAVGVEYGVSALLETGLRNKITTTDYEGNEQDYVTTNPDLLPTLGAVASEAFEPKYESMRAGRTTVGSKFAVTLTYFFNR